MSYRLAQLTRQIGRHATQFTTRRFGISPILKSATPPDFSNKYYWLKNMNENKYAFGITEEFMEEYGYPQMIFLEAEIDDVLMDGDTFAVIENEKAVVSLEAPFDNARLVHLDEDIDFDIVNDDPDNIENRICVFEDVNHSDTNGSGNGSGEDGVLQMALL